MSNDHMLLPQPGYVLPSTFAPYQPVPGISQFPLIQSTTTLPAIPPSPIANTDFFTRYNRLPSTPSLASDSDMDFKIVSWEELKGLLPGALSEGRVESGLLPDGRAFAPKTARKDNYFLFPSKSAYIIYYTQYYFSRENLDRDQTMRRMMTESSAVPIEKIIEAPRLASIATTVDDMKNAVQTTSTLLCLETDADGRCFVKRKDGYPGNSSPAFGSVEARPRASLDGSVNIVFAEHPPPSSPPTLGNEPLPRSDSTVPPSLATPSTSQPFANASDVGVYSHHQQPLFIRPPSRPVAPNAGIGPLAAAMAAMTFAQSTAPQHLFSHLPPQNHIAATLALLSQRGSAGLAAFANPMAPPFAVGQGRGGQPAQPPPHAFQHHQQQLFQHRRTTPPPQAQLFYPFQSQHPFYSFHPHHHHQSHEATGSQFAAAAFQPPTYDQWSTDAANAALAATGIQLQYITAAAVQQQQQPLVAHHHSVAQPPPPPPMMVWQAMRGPTMAVSTSATVQTPAPPPLHNSTPSLTGNSVAPPDDNPPGVAKDDPSIVSVNKGAAMPKSGDIAGLLPNQMLTNRMQPVSQPAPPPVPAPQLSRPNSGNGKGPKTKPSKGGGRSATVPAALTARNSATAAGAANKDQHTNHTNDAALTNAD